MMRTSAIVILLIGLAVGGYFIYSQSSVPRKALPASAPAPAVEDFINQQVLKDREIRTEAFKPSRPEAKEDIQVSPEKLCDSEESQDFECYEKYYSEQVLGKGIQAAMADIRSRYDSHEYIRSQCHPLMHVIGRAASQKFLDVGEAFAAADSFCWSGYHHGVLEGFIDRIGYRNLPAEINNICRKLAEAGQYSFDHYNCVHGLGHGVMAILQNELFDSLELCDHVTDSWERSSCWSGAFMENIIVDNKNHSTKYLKPADPLYPCNAADDKYRGVCYLMQTSYMLKVTNGDFGKVFELCSGVEEVYRATCYQSLGRDVSGRSLSDVQKTVAGCSLGRDLNQRKNCVIGAVKDFISYFHSDVEAKELCTAFSEAEAEVGDMCFSTAEAYYKIF